MLVHRLQDAGEDEKELDVLVGCPPRIQQVLALVRGKGPVVVLTGAVDAGKGLLVEETLHAVLRGHPLQRLHDDLVVVHRHISLGVDGSQLVLGRRHLIVLGLGCHAHLPQLLIDVLHE